MLNTCVVTSHPFVVYFSPSLPRTDKEAKTGRYVMGERKSKYGCKRHARMTSRKTCAGKESERDFHVFMYLCLQERAGRRRCEKLK